MKVHLFILQREYDDLPLPKLSFSPTVGDYIFKLYNVLEYETIFSPDGSYFKQVYGPIPNLQ